jgi:hypothetical protein
MVLVSTAILGSKSRWTHDGLTALISYRLSAWEELMKSASFKYLNLYKMLKPSTIF